jgi:hydrogenase maturation protein HypF
VVALSGACFQNRVLLEETMRLLEKDGFTVLSHALVPPHDGATALGQAAVGAARMLAKAKQPAA